MFNEIFNKFNLQMFADAGSAVMTTTGVVDAYSGAPVTVAKGYDMSPTMKEFYDTELLENARIELYYAQFGKKQPLPAGRGKTVEWRKWNTFDKAAVLQEGVIPTGQTFGMTHLTDSIEHYGTYATVSDQLELHAYDDVILGATEEMGASAAETQEWLIRQKLLTNANAFYCDNIDLTTGKPTGATPTGCGQMEASDAVMCLMTPDSVAKIATTMKKTRVPTINGKYYAVIHPSVAYDLRKSDAWIEAHKYAKPEEIFNGEIGELHGVRFIEDSYAPVLGGADYKNKAGTKTYATFFFGKDAFGIIDPEGGALEMIVKDKSQVGGPLNQFSTIGYKFETNGATILYPERLLRVMSCSSFSATDAAN
jgi:N4-gp56 family major capsid protein